MRKARLHAVALILAAVGPAAHLRAENDQQQSDLAAAVKRLFELGDEQTPKSLHEVQNYYRKLPEPVRDAPVMRYAYAVVLIRQKRLLDARPLLDQATAARPHDLAAWQASVWVHLTLGDRSQALAELERFDRALLGPTSAARREELQDAAEFCGRLFGFLSGPWHSRLHAADLEKLKTKLRGAFGPNDQAAFDEAEREVSAKFDELRGKQQSLGREARDRGKKRLDQARSDLLQSETALGEKQQALAEKDAKRADEFETKLAEIEGKLEKLDGERESLVAQITPLELQREALVAQLLPAPVVVPGLPIVSSGNRQLVSNASYAQTYNKRIEALLAPVVAQLTLLGGKLAVVVDAMTELELQRGKLALRRGQDDLKIAKQKKELDRQQVRLDHAGKRLNSAKAGSSVQSRAAAARLTLLSTYLEFPFDREKGRILSKLAVGERH